MQTDIADLKPRGRELDVTFKVIEKTDEREVTSKSDGSKHKVAEVRVGDATGTVLMTLWDDAIDLVEEGKTYELKNGYTSLFNNTIRLNVGRNGELVEKEEEIEPNTENDVSQKVYEREFRPRRFEGGSRRRFDRGRERRKRW